MPIVRTEDGVEIHYHVTDFRDPWITDPGETIVLSHGFARNMKWWTQCTPALARKYRVVRYDVRGCGESSAPPEGATWTAERVARDALDLIDHLGIQKVHWVGFESGGVWGQVFAVNFPDRLSSLTFINTPATGTGRTITEVPGQPRGSEAISKVGVRQWLLDTHWQRIDLSLTNPEMMEWHTAEQAKTPDHVAVGILRILETLDLSGMYSKISVPTLMMVSEKYRNCPLEEQIVVRRQIPDVRMVVFPNIGAGVQLFIPDRCTEEVLRFLTSVAGV